MKKKLQEAWLRFKHWLIKKLGGYTVQSVMPSVRYSIRAVNLHAERVVCHRRFDYREFFGRNPTAEEEQDVADRVKDELTYMIVREIIDKGYGVLTCEPDISSYPGSRIYTVTLCIVSPDEWVKTDLGNILSPI